MQYKKGLVTRNANGIFLAAVPFFFLYFCISIFLCHCIAITMLIYRSAALLIFISFPLSGKNLFHSYSSFKVFLCF